MLERHNEPAYLYFIGPPGGEEIKIGRSVNPGYRLSQLQTGHPEPLKLFRFVPHASPYTEKEVHDRFSHIRKTGEWFQYTDELKEFVRGIQYIQS